MQVQLAPHPQVSNSSWAAAEPKGTMPWGQQLGAHLSPATALLPSASVGLPVMT